MIIEKMITCTLLTFYSTLHMKYNLSLKYGITCDAMEMLSIKSTTWYS